jgi:hypothetical protein
MFISYKLLFWKPKVEIWNVFIENCNHFWRVAQLTRASCLDAINYRAETALDHGVSFLFFTAMPEPALLTCEQGVR